MITLDKTKNFIKKYWITFWLVVSFATVAGLIVYARYNDGRNVTKRVVATQKNETQMFSSDLLSKSTPQHFRTVETGTSTDQYFDISIYNYDLKNPGAVYPIDITYDLSVLFYNSTGTQPLNSAQVEAFIDTDEISLYDYNNTLSATPFLTVDKDSTSENNFVSRTVYTSSGVDKFRLVLPISMKDKDISVKVIAEPSGYSDLRQSISALFSIKTQTFTKIDGWTGDFNDDKGVNLSAYDGYNYSITGSGESEGTLSWRNDLLEPNQLQLSGLMKLGTSISTSGSTSSITIALDSEKSSGRYDIQFYVKDKNARTTIDGMTWDTFANSTTGVVTFVESP